MRRLAFLAFASAVALSVVALTRGAGTVVPAEVAPASRAAADPAPPPSESSRRHEIEAPLRNVFEYGVAPQARPAPSPAQPRAFGLRIAPVASSPDLVRFIGVVARGGGLKAALVIEGDVVLLSPGESTMGYTLLTLDRDEGATLRTPAGGELQAPVGP